MAMRISSAEIQFAYLRNSVLAVHWLSCNNTIKHTGKHQKDKIPIPAFVQLKQNILQKG